MHSASLTHQTYADISWHEMHINERLWSSGYLGTFPLTGIFNRANDANVTVGFLADAIKLNQPKFLESRDKLFVLAFSFQLVR